MTSAPTSSAVRLPARDRWYVIPAVLPIEVTEETAKLTVAEFFGLDNGIHGGELSIPVGHILHNSAAHSVMGGQRPTAEAL
ncbi:hypothetical protein Ppa06_70660 [Planomonospora parontospora subsp. parontospora]|uniref:Uncharacterized protein n=2 Tax=Planomonospora parontospora TaxID=58119 RepID=A0AA37F939_9ACTN|nr:hypothetical protein [Planomonospora parontospora]GGL01689.1 hypothetical protein GCM10010126_71150 [Planomonospora parontospora]GII13268.1 hypothetical protein Ppa06_70660 [Planomonospora parontospora subsp. parontospora]